MGYQKFLEFIGRRLIVANFDNWQIAVVNAVNGRIEPAIGDYIKYVWAYLFYFSDGSPKARLSKSKAFGSRLLHVLKRFLTFSIKPGQLYADGADQVTTSFSEQDIVTECNAPQSGQASDESCIAANSKAD